MTDDQTVNELIQKGMVQYAAYKGSKGALLLLYMPDLSKQKSLNLSGQQRKGIVEPWIHQEEFIQLCDLLKHNIIPTESLLATC